MIKVIKVEQLDMEMVDDGSEIFHIIADVEWKFTNHTEWFMNIGFTTTSLLEQSIEYHVETIIKRKLKARTLKSNLQNVLDSRYRS